MTYNYTKNNLYSRFKQAKLLTKRKVVFGSKLKPKKSLKRSTVRDKDIAHFTSFVLHKNTRVIFFLSYLSFVFIIHILIRIRLGGPKSSTSQLGRKLKWEI